MLLACFLKARENEWASAPSAPVATDELAAGNSPCESTMSSSSADELQAATTGRASDADADTAPLSAGVSEGGQAAEAASAPLRVFQESTTKAAEAAGDDAHTQLSAEERTELEELREMSNAHEESARAAAAEIAELKRALRLRERQTADMLQLYLERSECNGPSRRGMEPNGEIHESEGHDRCSAAGASTTMTPEASKPTRASPPSISRAEAPVEHRSSKLRAEDASSFGALDGPSEPSSTARSRASPPKAPETPSIMSTRASGRSSPSPRDVVATLSSEISCYQTRLRRLEAEKKATQKKIRANELTTLEQRKKAAAAHSQMSQALKAIEGTACTLKLQLDASRTENRRLRDDADASNAKLLGVIEDLNGKISYYSETVHSHANKRAELENALLQRTKELRAAHTELCALRERLSRAEASAAHDVSQRAAAEKRALHASRGALELMKATSIRSRSERRRSSIAVPCASH